MLSKAGLPTLRCTNFSIEQLNLPTTVQSVRSSKLPTTPQLRRTADHHMPSELSPFSAIQSQPSAPSLTSLLLPFTFTASPSLQLHTEVSIRVEVQTPNHLRPLPHYSMACVTHHMQLRIWQKSMQAQDQLHNLKLCLQRERVVVSILFKPSGTPINTSSSLRPNTATIVLKSSSRAEIIV